MGIALGCVYSLFKGPINDSNPAKIEDPIVAGLIFFIWGCVGFLWTFRQEALSHGGIIFRGTEAKNYGIFMMAINWGLLLLFLYIATRISNPQ